MPVSVGSGAVFTIQHDFTLIGGVNVIWDRHYSTTSAADAWLGRGWTVPYFMNLERVTDGLRLLDEVGNYVVFPVPGGVLRPGDVVSRFGANMELRWEQGFFTITHWHHGANHVEQFVFRDSGQRVMPLVRLETVPGYRVTIAHDARGRPARITQELEGRVIELMYDARDLITHAVYLADDGSRRTLARYEYDRDRHLVLATDQGGNPTVYLYDGRHRLVSETSPLGATFRFEYDDRGRCVRAWGDGGYMERRLAYSTAPHRTRVTDSLGHHTDHYLNAAGQVVQEVSPLGAVTTTEYDEHGRPIREMDPDGHAVGYVYDERGNRAAVVHEDGSVSTLEFDGHLFRAYTSPTGARWEFVRNERGFPVATVDPLGRSWESVWDSAGALAEVRTPGRAVTRYRYGPRYRWIEVSDDVGLIGRVEYDEFNNRTAVYDAGGLLFRARYNAADQMIEHSDALGRVYLYTWNAINSLLEYAGPGGDWSRYEYDRFGETSAHHNAVGSMRLEYDSEGQLTAVVNRAGERLERRYDPDGRVVEERTFNGGVELTDYSPGGEIKTITLPDGQTITCRYSPTGFLRRCEGSDGFVEEYQFDANGELLLASNPDGVLEIERDAAGRIVAEVQNGRRVEYGYDIDSRLVSRRFSGAAAGANLKLEYDPRSRLTRLSDEAGLFQEFRYNARDALAERRSAGGVVVRLEYDAAGRLLGQRVTAASDSGVVRRYEYDLRDNVTTRDDSRRGRVAYEYDAIDRLVGATGPAGREFYSYDPNGAITATHRGSRAVAPGGRTLDDGTRQFEYDAGGSVRMIRSPGGERELAYNIKGDLTRVRLPDGTEVRYQYDPLGRRLSKEVAGEKTEYMWQGCELIAEIRDGGVADVFFARDLEPAAQWRGTRRLTPVTDGAGALQEVYDEGGALVWECTLDSYGNLLSESGPAPNATRFRGQFFDPETGFHYNLHRYYDPLLCDYLSPDPVGLEATSNFYAYPRNPLTWDDPFGLRCSNKSFEKRMDKYFRSQGYRKMKNPAGKPKGSVNGNGIDGVYVFDPKLKGAKGKSPPPQYIIADAKFGPGAYLHQTETGRQMSDKWIDSKVRPEHKETRLEKAVGKTQADDINKAAKQPNQDPTTPNVQKVVYATDGHGQPVTTDPKPYTNSGNDEW